MRRCVSFVSILSPSQDVAIDMTTFPMHAVVARLARPLAWGGLVGSGALMVIALLSAAIWQPSAVLAVAVSGGLVIAWCILGHLAEAVAFLHLDASGLAVVAGSFLARGGGVLALLVWFWSNPEVRDALDPVWMGVGFVAAVAGWQAGLVAVHSRLRQPIYDVDYQPPRDAEDVA